MSFEEMLRELDVNLRAIQASGILDPENNSNMYEHLRNDPNYAAFCERIYGKKESGGLTSQGGSTREKEKIRKSAEANEAAS